MSTTTYTTQPQGLVLCSRCHPAWASEAPQWVPARTPTVHWGPGDGEVVGGPTPTPQMSKSRCNDASPRQSNTHVFRQTADRRKCACASHLRFREMARLKKVLYPACLHGSGVSQFVRVGDSAPVRYCFFFFFFNFLGSEVPFLVHADLRKKSSKRNSTSSTWRALASCSRCAGQRERQRYIRPCANKCSMNDSFFLKTLSCGEVGWCGVLAILRGLDCFFICFYSGNGESMVGGQIF